MQAPVAGHAGRRWRLSLASENIVVESTAKSWAQEHLLLSRAASSPARSRGGSPVPVPQPVMGDAEGGGVVVALAELA